MSIKMPIANGGLGKTSGRSMRDEIFLRPAGRPTAIVAVGLNGKRFTVSPPSAARCSVVGLAASSPGNVFSIHLRGT